MKPYTFEVTTSTAKPWKQSIDGQYIYYDEALAGVDSPQIRVETSEGDVVLLKPGKGVTVGRRFKDLRIFNKAGALSITGVIQVGDADENIDENRVQGDVNVIDGGKSITLANAAFFKKGSQQGVSGEYSHIQLLNPSGSGVRTIVENIIPSAHSGTGAFGLRRYDTALSTLDGAGVNKNTGGPAGKTLVYDGTNVAILGINTPLQAYGIAPLTLPTGFRLSKPIVLYPGQGYVVVWDQVNCTMACAFEWTEEAYL